MTFLSSAYNSQTLQNNSIYPDLLPEEMDMLYSAYGDETGVQCALRFALKNVQSVICYKDKTCILPCLVLFMVLACFSVFSGL